MKKWILLLAAVLFIAQPLYAIPPMPGGGGGTSVTLTDSTSTTSSTVAASATAVKAAYDHGTGLQITGSISASGDVTNFPAATKGDVYQVSSAGWLGGAAGVGEYVNAGDLLICTATTSAGTKAQVYNPPGQYWNIQKAMISTPDGYRKVEMASNTTAPTITNGYYWLNNVFTVVQNSTPLTVQNLPITPVACSGNCSPTATQLSNGIVNNYGQTSSNSVITGPTPAAGMNFVMIHGSAPTGSAYYEYHSNAANVYLDGSTTAVTNVIFTIQPVGSGMSCVSFQTGASAYSLKCTTIAGTNTTS